MEGRKKTVGLGLFENRREHLAAVLKGGIKKTELTKLCIKRKNAVKS